MKSAHQQRVERFMREVAGQEVLSKPKLPDAVIRRLRAKLILEEALETVKALGFMGKVEPTTSGHHFDIFPVGEPSLVSIADGCADISVVTVGTLSACGIVDTPLLEEVDRSNLAKVGGYRRADGKWMKPATWTPPDIKGVLKGMM